MAWSPGEEPREVWVILGEVLTHPGGALNQQVLQLLGGELTFLPPGWGPLPALSA